MFIFFLKVGSWVGFFSGIVWMDDLRWGWEKLLLQKAAEMDGKVLLETTAEMDGKPDT